MDNRKLVRVDGGAVLGSLPCDGIQGGEHGQHTKTERPGPYPPLTILGASLMLRESKRVVHARPHLVEQDTETLQVLQRNHQPRVVNVTGAEARAHI